MNGARLTHHAPARGITSRYRQSGMSLVELMVAMTIGLFIMGAVGAIYVSTSTSSRSSMLESQMNEDASLALEMLQQQIRLAGYSGFDAAGTRNFQGIAVRGCDGGFTNNAAADDFEAMVCGANQDGPDAIAIRYEATTLNTQPIDNTQPTNCSFYGIAGWDTGGGVIYPLADNRYYVAPDKVNGDTPTLYCKGKDGASTGGRFSPALALVPNIEDFQVTYAVTAAPVDDEPMPHQVTAYVDAKDATLGATLGNWSRVAGVRICLLARTSQVVSTGGASRNDLGFFRDCNGKDQVIADGFLRRAFTTTIQLRNMRPAVPADYAMDSNGAVRDPWSHLTEAE